jgi:type IV pilus assembly protein PilM
LIDYGGNRTGIAVVQRGVPLFTNTVALGGGVITRAIIEKTGASEAEAESLKNKEGITGDAHGREIAEIASAHVSALGDQVLRVYHFWDTRRDERGEHVAPISKVVLVGGGANLKGIADYIASRVQVRTERGNVWRSALDFDRSIPSVDRRESLRYATAVGLALRDLP